MVVMSIFNLESNNSTIGSNIMNPICKIEGKVTCIRFYKDSLILASTDSGKLILVDPASCEIIN